MGDEIGSLEVGKQADLILVDLKSLNLSPVLETPIRKFVPNLIYAACAASRAKRGSGHEVKTVMVAGQILVKGGEVLTADEEVVRAEAQVQAEAVAKRVARVDAPAALSAIDSAFAPRVACGNARTGHSRPWLRIRGQVGYHSTARQQSVAPMSFPPQRLRRGGLLVLC